MGIFDSIARGLGSLRTLSDAELEGEREALRKRYVGSGESISRAGRLYDELHRYDAEMSRRAKRVDDRENPNPPETRHREHGHHLLKDD